MKIKFFMHTCNQINWENVLINENKNNNKK
jgi:hypothetical protein